MNESDIQEQIEAHVARNRELKKLITDNGVALEDRRTIDLHFWAVDEQAAESLSIALNEAGYSVTVKRRVDEYDVWNVESQIDASPLEVTERSFTERLVRLASTHESEFDGWGTEL